MPARLPLVVCLSVAALLLLGGSTMRSVSAQRPPEVPDTLMLRGNTQPVVGEQASPEFFGPDLQRPDFANPRFISDDLSVSAEVLPATAPSTSVLPTSVPPACGPLGGRFNFIPRLHNYIFNPPERHRDIGRPLTRESWRYRPFGLGIFVGYIGGDTLIDDWTGSDGGTLGGLRLSWDPGYYWGCEFRYAATSMGQWDSLTAKHALEAAARTYDSHRDVNLQLWDFSLLWYPWGDTTWRPYALVGLGGSLVRFDDAFLEHWSQKQFAMPLALGLKYRYNSRLAFRFELADNIVFGSGQVNTLHHFSITGGLEMRFGGDRKAYWPWSPGRYYW